VAWPGHDAPRRGRRQSVGALACSAVKDNLRRVTADVLTGPPGVILAFVLDVVIGGGGYLLDRMRAKVTGRPVETIW
jgi:hypothetical protein